MLETYGFVLPDCPYDTVALPLPDCGNVAEHATFHPFTVLWLIPVQACQCACNHADPTRLPLLKLLCPYDPEDDSDAVGSEWLTELLTLSREDPDTSLASCLKVYRLCLCDADTLSRNRSKSVVSVILQ